MCGRFALSAPIEHIRKHFFLDNEVFLEPRYNIAPAQDIAVVRKGERGGNRIDLMRWGLIPSWARDRKTGYRMINARAETLGESRSFRILFRMYRCLIPADGFYEWQAVAGSKQKQPYFMHRENHELFAFAGLCNSWTDPADGSKVDSCAIITTIPNSLLQEIHDRMPVILPRDRYEIWLDPQSRPAALKALLTPVDPGFLAWYRVSGLCNSPRHDSVECIQAGPGDIAT